MKIAIFTETYYPQVNGVVTSTDILSKKLEALGHQVLIIGPKVEGYTESTDKVWRFRSVVFPFQPEHRMISPLSRKLRQFKAMNFDIIHVQTPIFMGHLGQFLSWRYQIPMVHTYHTFWAEYLHYFPVLPKSLRKQADLLVLSRNFCNRCQHVIVPSNQMKDKLKEYDVAVPMTVIPTGVDMHKTDIGDPNEFRKRFGLANDDKVCIFVGRLGKEKNVYFLIDVFEQVLAKEPKAKLLILGDGPERQGMTDYAFKKGFGEKLIFTGYLTRPEVFTAYGASDVITFPSKTETQGLCLLEGLSAGTPAVCINAMGVKDILGDNKGGFLVYDDLDTYAATVVKLLKDSDLWQQKHEEAYKQAEYFSADNMAAETIKVYEEAIQYKKLIKKEPSKTLEGFFKKGSFWRLFFRKDDEENEDNS
jgi:1,2-diacylglycerol 3-alpha-glucosyltransferase